MQNTAKQNYPGSVAFYDTQPGNDMGYWAFCTTSLSPRKASYEVNGSLAHRGVLTVTDRGRLESPTGCTGQSSDTHS